jgi:Na+/proline symporter
VLDATPVWCQLLFFGAVLSAILSTASGTLLAPASVLTENVLQPFLKHFDDRTMLWTVRLMLVGVSVTATLIACNSESTMYEMVESGYKVSLVVAFVPLVFGIYWKRASTQAALCSILLAVPVWLWAETVFDEASPAVWRQVPPQLYGLAASIVGMLAGGTIPELIPHAEPDHEALEARRATAAH